MQTGHAGRERSYAEQGTIVIEGGNSQVKLVLVVMSSTTYRASSF